VQRHGATTKRVTQTLERKVKRAFAEADDEKRAEALGWVPEIVASLEASGALDDRLFAELFARSLHRSGKSRRLIRTRMAQKGVPRELATRAIALLDEESEDVDGDAALEFARKRRFGPFRRPDVELDDARRQKELSAFARAGYGFDIARKMVEAEPDEK